MTSADRSGQRRSGPRGSRQARQPSALQRAIGLLSRREHSRLELLRKLAARGVAPQEAEAAVAQLAGEGWQDDARFAESLVRSRAGAGYGPVRIRAELATHGLGETEVSRALVACAIDWRENARALVRRRVGDLQGQPALRRKAAELLYRRGFSSDQVASALDGLDVRED
jgi:regulatory protein